MASSDGDWARDNTTPALTTTTAVTSGDKLGMFVQEPPPQVMRLTWLMIVFILMYTIIFILGVTGNSLVVFIVLRKKAMQTITNIFITNLALSDILMCLLAVPFTPVSFWLNSWIFGDALCHIVPMTQCISVYVSTLTSTAIAVDRYFVIVYPFKPRMKVFMCVLMIIAIWIISVSISLPLGIYNVVKLDNSTNSYSCVEEWPRPQARQFFTVTSLVLQYIVPCSIITFCYTMVSIALKRRTKVKIGSGSRTRERDELEIKRKKRTNKMLIAMVTIFLCCWMPLNMVHLVREYETEDQVSGWYYFTLVFFIAHVIAMSSTIYNPFLYAWMNDNFKKEFHQIMPCMFRGSSHNSNGCNYTQYTNVDNQPSAVINRSPMRNGSENCAKDTKAYYDADSEKVHLNLADKEEKEEKQQQENGET